MNDVIISLAKVAAALALLVLALAVSARWSSMARMPAELRRKLIHVALGSFCVSFPLWFSQAWEVLLACALAIGVFALARTRLRSALGAGLHAVKRASHGEVYFTLAVAFLFVSRQVAPESLGPTAAYVLPLAVLTISDAAAALVGTRFGRTPLYVAGARKTWEGVAAFALTGWLVAYASLAWFTELSAVEISCLSIIVAAVGAAIEAVTTRGLDNIAIPVGLYIVLTAVLNDGFDWALTATFAASSSLAFAVLAAAPAAEAAR
jgi:dolichol kinase